MTKRVPAWRVTEALWGRESDPDESYEQWMEMERLLSQHGKVDAAGQVAWATCEKWIRWNHRFTLTGEARDRDLAAVAALFGNAA